MSVEIKKVTTKKELRQFVKFNIDLYKGNPYHVPSLIDEEVMTIDPEKNPAFEVCDAVYFLAYKENKLVGRIAGIINKRSNETWHQSCARFGFVDFIDDKEVSEALFDAIQHWAKSEGMTQLHGPMGFTDLDHEGMLVKGFDQLGTMSTIYNYPYYPMHMERMGFKKEQDWKEFKIFIPEEVPQKHLRIGEIVKRRSGLKTLKFTKRKEIMPYAKPLFETLNKAYAPLYGFSKLTDKQIDYYIKMYIPMVRLDMITLIIREKDQAVVGFGITLPSLSKGMQKAKGKLLPFGWFHLLKALKSKPKVVDLYLVGVLPEYQSKGVNALLFNDLIPVYQKLGVTYAESNPELENNNAVQAQWGYFKTEHHKTRRAYVKNIEG